MKNASVTFIAAAMFFFFLVVSSFGADAVKIGVFDISEVMDRSKRGQLAKTSFEKELKQKGDELEKRAKGIKELKEQLDRQHPTIESSVAEQIASEIRLKISDLKNRKAKYSRQLNISKDKVLKEMFEEVTAVADEIGKREGYTMILFKQDRPPLNVLYTAEEVDITDKVIDTYDTQFVKKGKEKNR